MENLAHVEFDDNSDDGSQCDGTRRRRPVVSKLSAIRYQLSVISYPLSVLENCPIAIARALGRQGRPQLVPDD
jgi:hypothetical protein